MRSRLEYAGIMWLMIDQELQNWIEWSDQNGGEGHLVPEDIAYGLAGAEEAWEHSAEYHDWAVAELRKVNERLEHYYVIGQYMEMVYGIEMVSIVYSSYSLFS
jgi:hypothetical protein